MSTKISSKKWKQIEVLLKQPFAPHEVEFRILRQTKNNQGRWCSEVAAYVSKVTIMRRLDMVVGPQNWEYRFTPLVTDTVPKKISVPNEGGQGYHQESIPVLEVTHAKGELTIFGISKEGLGSASNTNPSKGCDSDTMKRTAIMWGIGRYLYDMKGILLDPQDVVDKKIREEVIANLRANLPVPKYPLKRIEVEDEETLSYTESHSDEKLPVSPVSHGFATAESDEETHDFKEPEAEQESEGVAEEPDEFSGEEIEDDEAEALPQGEPIPKARQSKNRGALLADYATAVNEKELPTGEGWEVDEALNVCAFLKIDPVINWIQCVTDTQLKSATGAVRAGKLTWGEMEK